MPARIVSAVAVPFLLYAVLGRWLLPAGLAPLFLLLPFLGLGTVMTGIAGGRWAQGLPRVSERTAAVLLPWFGFASIAFLLLAFVRSVFLADALALFVLYGGVFVTFARISGRPIGRTVGEGAKNAGIVLACALATLVLAELMTRVVYGNPRPIDTGNTQWHPTRVYTLTPNFKGEHLFDNGGTIMRMPIFYSAQGLRDVEIGPKQPGEFRVVILGDSYTIGQTLPLEKTVAKQVEAKLRGRLARRVTVINGGVAGYGPWQERDFLREVCLPLDPDLVIEQVLPSNDIDNTLCKTGKFPESYNTKWRARYHFLVFRNAWQMQVERGLRRFSRFYGMVSDAAMRPFFVEALNQIRLAPRLDVPKLPPSAPRNELIEVNLRDWYPTLEEGWSMMQDDMRGVRDDCRERGIEFMMYSVPIQQVVRDAWWQSATNGLGIYERDKDTRIVREFCSREKIPFIEILPAIRSHPDVGSLYYNPDGHFTPSGAELVAEVIADYLCTHSFGDCTEE